ncbi:ClpXP protease specificity-enhancing factor [Xanthomonas sp. H13-6]|uniref:ClpXP protease specificity-enhancing factor n=1 Tax=Xanthomonas chitinilytica TaxID=2989819 RepID=A0ABT3JRR8_9XANT|nr:ClpXP protease specificity-enhancing factor [Xanthomonas sp. H13-6]MCW4471130.1 ClpXP protease specificity-enhancing factor [Xanthomonas sp. H13-6]
MTEETFRMTSHRPYLLRALVEWINDNGMTPHILVDAGLPGVQVPASAVKEGRVVLNIAERAVMRLQIDNDGVSFTARFSGVSFPVQVPISAVLAVYARETGQGMALPDDIAGSDGPPDDDLPPPTSPPDEPPTAGKRPHLRVVK